jgi:transcriptional regulator with XRE-family HTH domain
MDAARVLRQERRRAGLTQRQLADRTGVPQPAVARIESGTVVPRVDTLDRLLAGCGRSLEVAPRLGEGLDRTGIALLLDLTEWERGRIAVDEANNLAELLERAHPDEG